MAVSGHGSNMRVWLATAGTTWEATVLTYGEATVLTNGVATVLTRGVATFLTKGGGNMAVRVGSSSISGSVRVSIAVDQSRVSLSLTLAIMGVGESAHEGGGVCTTIDTIGPGV